MAIAHWETSWKQRENRGGRYQQWHFAAGAWIPRLFVGWCLGTGHFVAGGCLLYFGIIWKGACCYEARILYSSSFLPYEFWHCLTRRLYFKDLKLKIGYGPVSLLQSGSRVEQMHPWRANSFWLAWHRQIPCRLEPEKRHWPKPTLGRTWSAHPFKNPGGPYKLGSLKVDKSSLQSTLNIFECYKVHAGPS